MFGHQFIVQFHGLFQHHLVILIGHGPVWNRDWFGMEILAHTSVQLWVLRPDFDGLSQKNWKYRGS